MNLFSSSGKRFILKLLVLPLFLTFTLQEAYALSGLYGITSDGKLVTVNTTTGLTTVIRSALPVGGTYHSLVIQSDYFYSFNTEGNLYRFGLNSGDEIFVGHTSYTVLGMSIKPTDGRCFAAVSTDGDLRGDYIGEVNLTNGSVSGLLTLNASNASYVSGLQAVSFYANSELFATSYPATGWSYVYRVLQSNGNIYDVSGADQHPYSLGGVICIGLAIEPSNQTVYCLEKNGSGNLRYLRRIIDAYPTPEFSSQVYIATLVAPDLSPSGSGGAFVGVNAIAYPSSVFPPSSTSTEFYLIPGLSGGNTVVFF